MCLEISAQILRACYIALTRYSIVCVSVSCLHYQTGENPDATCCYHLQVDISAASDCDDLIRNTECSDQSCQCNDGLILYAEAVCQVQLVGMFSLTFFDHSW